MVTNGSEAETKKVVEETKMKSPVIWEKTLASMKKLGFEGYPAAADVDKVIADEEKLAQTAFDEKRYFDAQTSWKRISAACKGLDAAKTADEKLADLAKDANLKKEIDAGARIAEAQKADDAGKT